MDRDTVIEILRRAVAWSMTHPLPMPADPAQAHSWDPPEDMVQAAMRRPAPSAPDAPERYHIEPLHIPLSTPPTEPQVVVIGATFGEYPSWWDGSEYRGIYQDCLAARRDRWRGDQVVVQPVGHWRRVTWGG